MGIGGATTLGVQDSQVTLRSGPSAAFVFGYPFGSFRRRPPPQKDFEIAARRLEVLAADPLIRLDAAV